MRLVRRDRERASQPKALRALVAVTPPIVAAGVKRALVRVGLRTPLTTTAADAPAAPGPGEPLLTGCEAPSSSEPSDAAAASELAEWEYVPEGWERATPGWDAGTVADAYLDKWAEWVEALAGPAPLGVYHEAVSGVSIAREDLGAHNMILSFAYVLARAAHGREKLSVLDWGGGLGHYAVVARAVMPEIELEWHCREVPSVVQAGELANPMVTFHADDHCLRRTYDLVLASGSLQYEVDWQSRLRRFAGATKGYLLVTRLPIALHAPSFVILQRAYAYGYATEYAGWVVSRDELLEVAESAGLELERELLLDAWLAGIGAPEEPIWHRGFLFRPVAQVSD